MLKNLFERLTGAKPVRREEPTLSPGTKALMHAIQERSRDDPLIGAKLGSKEVLQRLVDSMKNERGVHIESLLCALGALAGYACQASLRGQALAKGLPETAALMDVGLNDGRRFFFGDPLNQLIYESQYSVWGLAAGMAQQLGAKPSLDVQEIFQHTSQTLGQESYGRLRVPDNHRASDLPINYLKALWPVLLPTVRLFCEQPQHWHLVYALAIQQVQEMGKSVIDAELALQIIMESAIPMSKVDLGTLQAFKA